MEITVETLRRDTLKRSLKNGKKNEHEAYLLINELEAQVTELKNKLN